MKKITLMFFMCFLSFGAFAQFPEDFEDGWTNFTTGAGTDGPGGPTGWYIRNITGALAWSVNPSTYPAHSGTVAAFMNRQVLPVGQLAEDWLVTPQATTIPANGELHFWSKLNGSGDTGSHYYVYMNDTAGSTQTTWADYEVIADWTETSINTIQNAWQEKTVLLNTTATTAYFAFVMTNNAGDIWVVDDVKIVAPCTAPNTLTAGNFTLNSANLSWANPSGATQFEIVITTVDGSLGGSGYTFTSATPTFNATQTLPGNVPFAPNTDYRYWVRAICDDGGVSTWGGPYAFSTLAYGEGCAAPIVVTTLPYSSPLDNTSNYGDVVDGSPGASGCGTTSGYLNGNDVFYSYTAGFTGIVSIDVTNNGAYSGVFVYTSCANVGVSCSAGAVAGGTATPLSIPTFSVTQGQTYYVVISTWATPQTTPYVLTIQQVNCEKPVGQATTGIGMTSANLNWTNPSNATSWKVVVQDPGEGIPAVGAGITASVNQGFTVTAETDGPLASATPYEYYVAADCGNGTYSAWAGPYLFNTMICEAVDQCTYTFILTDQASDGWNGNTMTVSQNGIAIATLSMTEGAGPVNVPVQVCNGFPVQLYWNSGGNWSQEVGVAVRNSFNQIVYSKPFGVGIQNSMLYSSIGNCLTPECLPPTGLEVTEIGQTSAQIGWDGPVTGNWEYVVVAAGAPAPTGAGTPTTTNPTLVDTGLVAASNYEFYVRMQCTGAATPTSTWAGPFPFTTSTCEPSAKCAYTFTLTSQAWMGGWAGGTMTVTQGGVYVATLGPTFTTGASQDVVVMLCTGQPYEITYTSGGNGAWANGFSLTNIFDQTLFTFEPDEEAVGDVLYTSTADCNNPACLPPTGLYTQNETMTSVELGWDGPETGAWEYIIVADGATAPTADTPGIATSNNTTLVDSGLTAATNYEFYVRLVCTGATTPTSTWAGPYDFHTEVCEESEKCTFFFEMTSEQGYGWGGYTASIFQGGTPVATIGEDFGWGESQTVEIALCPGVEVQIVYNDYIWGWQPEDKGLNVYTPYQEDFAILAPGTLIPGTTVFTGIPSCDPPPCPRPQNIEISEVTLNTAQIDWTEMGDAETWEVWVVPAGSPAPTTPGDVVTLAELPYIADELLSGTPYDVYVRANCGTEDGYSNWAGPETFVTVIENDDCAAATSVGVNSNMDCTVFAGGTLSGATSSGVQSSCYWEAPEYDVWYTFEATATTHVINLNSVVNVQPAFAVFSGGDCADLTELGCGEFDYNSQEANGVISGLVPGETYTIQVYAGYLNDPTDITSFNVCIKTPATIFVNNTDRTVPELVQEVLVTTSCAQVSNITWSTGNTQGRPQNGIAYFEDGSSDFPMQKGIILATGDAMGSPGPNLSLLGNQDYPGWAGDDQLHDYMVDLGILEEYDDYNDATILEFDFVPLTTHMKFPFVFASEEYGTFQCSYSDAFAFFLTAPDGTVTNLAVLPNSDTPVSVVTIRDEQFNPGCDSQNPEYFFNYYGDDYDGGVDPNLAPVNYEGNTVKLIAQSDVVMNETYHIKLVIADRGDNAYNSAVFIGPFDIGQVDLGVDLTQNDGNALCNGQQYILDTHLDPTEYSFEWFKDDVEIEGETGATLTVTEDGEYTVTAQYLLSTCAGTDSIVIEFYPAVEEVTGNPADLAECDSSGYDVFDLSDNTTTILEGLTPADYTVTYYASEAEAQDGTADGLDLSYTNTVQFEQPIWVRIFNNVTGCFGVKTFNLIVSTTPPVVTITPDFSICFSGGSGEITVTSADFDPADATYTWTHDGNDIADTTSTITVTEGGVYEVTANHLGCTATASTTVGVIPAPVPEVPADVDACNSYILPVFATTGQTYLNVNGDPLSPGDVLTDTQVVTVRAESNTTPPCYAEDTFQVTIVPGPVLAPVTDVAACDSYTLPALAEGNYFTATGGGGTPLSAGAVIETTQTIYVYVETLTCTSEVFFTVTISTAPVIDAPVDVAACGTYELPPLAGGNYYTEELGGGTMLNAGDAVTLTQTIYVYEAAADNADCYSQNSFEVVIVPAPVVDVTQGCEDGAYVLGADTANGTYVWTDPSGVEIGTEATVIVKVAGLYHVTVTPVAETDCPFVVDVPVESTACSIPRGISPDNDGKNDEFDLTALDVMKLRIYNRYGTEVYSYSNYTNQWHGQQDSGSELPTGTYFYMVERRNGISLTGWVYINRRD